MFRACRLVVDTGIHAFNWTSERAVDYMLNYTASSRQQLEVSTLPSRSPEDRRAKTDAAQDKYSLHSPAKRAQFRRRHESSTAFDRAMITVTPTPHYPWMR